MNVTPLAIPDVLLIEPKVFGDARGFFLETWQARDYAAAGIDLRFVQDNHSRSGRGILRGLHYQLVKPQGKLVRVVTGEVFDVAVDMRRHSPSFGRWVGARLSEDNKHQLWVPPGFAHGFYVLSDSADFIYKCTEFYSPQDERSLRWNDPDLAIDWPISGEPLLAKKDAEAPFFRDAEAYP